MFKTITCTTLLIMSFSANAFVTFDSAMTSVTSLVSNDLDSTVDLLESSTDLLNEVNDDTSANGQFTTDMKEFNRGIKDLEYNMRYLGYSEDDIRTNLQKLSSNKLSLEQKMRALTKSVRNIKKMKAMLNKISPNGGAQTKSNTDPSNQAILANQQQLLHLQINQLKQNEMSQLDGQISDLAFKKSIAYELDRAKVDLINSKERSKTRKLLSSSSFNIATLQKRAIQMSLCLCVLGCIGLMVTFFKEEGLATLKAGFLGVVLSYLIPSIVTLYSHWLGI